MTELLFRDDPYLRECDATVRAVNDRGGIILDRTVFYATGGGQPGDRGVLEIEGAEPIEIATTVYGEDREEIVHVPAEGSALPEPGQRVHARIDWETRYRRMRLHTLMHLLCSVLPYPVTGGQIGDDAARLDFDIPDAGLVDKETITAELNGLTAKDLPVTSRWISDEELAANPELVRTMSVKPPTGSGRVRLIEIGGGEIDRQPCGGTHVASTAEIGEAVVTKIENKGRQNRRVRIALV